MTKLIKVEATVCGMTIERVYEVNTTNEAYNEYVKDVIENGGLEVSNIEFIAMSELTDTIDYKDVDADAEAFAISALEHIRNTSESLMYYIDDGAVLSRTRLKQYISQLKDLEAYIDDAVMNVEHIATY
jgi:hypothetical protein